MCLLSKAQNITKCPMLFTMVSYVFVLALFSLCVFIIYYLFFLSDLTRLQIHAHAIASFLSASVTFRSIASVNC